MQSNRLNEEFIKNSGIRFIELGIESYNDNILRNQKKPATTHIIDLACQKIRDINNSGGNVYLIPNIIVGFPEETNETYQRTYDFLLKNKDIISHLNIYNLAVYSDTDLSKEIKSKSTDDSDENSTIKSFHTDPKIHQEWHKKFINLGNEFLDKDVNISQPQHTDFSSWMKNREKRRVSLPQIGREVA